MEDIDEEEEKQEEKEEIGNNNDNDEAQYDDGIDFDDGENNKNAVESETPRHQNKVTAKFIENKRKMF